MFAKTPTRIEENTRPEMKARLHQRLLANVSPYVNGDRQRIDQRLKELEKEWTIERAIELEAPIMIGLGATLGLLHSRKWFALSGVAASMVVLHNTGGWYPLLPVFQKMGLRSQKDIDTETNALRVLRKDHQRYLRH